MSHPTGPFTPAAGEVEVLPSPLAEAETSEALAAGAVPAGPWQ